MTSDPTDIATTEMDVAGMEVEHVLASSGGASEITSGGVHDALGLAGGSRSVEKEHGVLRVDVLGREVRGPLLGLLVPPKVATLRPGDLGTGALVDEHVLDIGALLQGIVDNLLGTDKLAASPALIRGDDDLGVTVDNTVAKGVGGETSEDDRVDGADTNASKQGDNGFGNHGQVDGNGIALADAHLLQHPGSLGDLPKELTKSDDAAITRLVSFIDDSGSIGVRESVTIDTVVRSVELAFYEPGTVATGEGSGLDGLEVARPRKELPSLAAPKLLRFADRLIVQPLVVLET